jgi:predicted O-methyltransferase YrrM
MLRAPAATIADLLPEGIKESLRGARAAWRDARDWRAYRRAPTLPPPHAVKVRAVLSAARRHGLPVLLETGTFEGEMARKCRRAFEAIHTIELDPGLAARAARRLGRWPSIHVHQGDSAEVMPRILARVAEPVLFWLDGHYSGEGTAHGACETPLPEELAAIARRAHPGDVVLIDDLRLLGSGAYPDVEAVRSILAAAHPGHVLTMADDMLRWEPRVGGNPIPETTR